MTDDTLCHQYRGQINHNM